MEKATFWTRVGHWFKPTERSNGLDEIGGDGGLTDGRRASLAGEVITGDAPSGSRFRLARTSSTVERLEEEYTRIVRLVESVQTHLEQQGERTDVMARSLSSVAQSLEALPESSRTNSETLAAINQRLETDGACLKRLDDNLSQFPQLADAQREAMVSIGRHLDLSRQTNDKLVTTLDGFQQAVTLVSEATAASARTLQDLRSDASARENRIASVLQEQTHRLTMFAIAVLGLGAIAAGAAIFALIRS